MRVYVHTCTSVKHVCLLNFLHRFKLFLSLTYKYSTARGLNADCMFQGEMGPEGLRGLAGESGNKGTKVRRCHLEMFI